MGKRTGESFLYLLAKKQFIVFLFILFLMVSACAVWEGKDEFVKPESIPTNSLSTQNPASTPLISPLSDFPISVGNTWVYSHTAYFLEDTATYIITDTVIHAEKSGPYYIAEVQREWLPNSGNLSEDKVYGLEQTQYWYIVDGFQVYKQTEEPDLSNVDASFLEYIFPLDVGTSWFPSAEQREGVAIGYSGHRRVESLADMNVPAGNFTECSYLFTGFNNGSDLEWFCPGIGIVMRRFDHQGTAYGFETLLVDYVIKK